MVSGTLVADVTQSALGTPAQEVFDSLTPEQQELVLRVQRKALETIVNTGTSSASAAAVRAVGNLLQQSIGDLSCVTKLRSADQDESLNAMPFDDDVMLRIVTLWTNSLRKNHKWLTGRRMTGLAKSEDADEPSWARDVAFTGLNTEKELLKIDKTLRRRLEGVGDGCLLDRPKGSVDERRLRRTLGAARRSDEFASRFVHDNSGMANTVDRKSVV